MVITSGSPANSALYALMTKAEFDFVQFLGWVSHSVTPPDLHVCSQPFEGKLRSLEDTFKVTRKPARRYMQAVQNER